MQYNMEGFSKVPLRTGAYTNLVQCTRTNKRAAARNFNKLKTEI
jgi:hypothetical protein